MGFIFIPKLTKKHWYFLAFSISAFLRDYLSYLNFNDYLKKGKEDDHFKESPVQKRYFDILSNVISDCLQSIFVLFQRIKVRKESSNIIENKETIRTTKNIKGKENESTFSSFFKIMIKISLLDFFCQFVFFLFAFIFNKDDIILRRNNNYLLLVDISSRFLFCRLFLNTYFYRHHIISMIINLVIFLALGSFDIYYIFIEKDNDIKKIANELEIIIFFIILIIQTIAYSLEDVLNKIALSDESLTPYSLLFYKGVFQIPIVIITSIIFLPFNNAFSDFNYLDTGYKKYVLVRRALFIIFNMSRSIFLVKVIDKFSSQHLSILKVLESICMFGFFLFDRQYENQNEKVYIPIISICFIITIFTSLIYNEIIVVNLCGMQDYTQHGLDIQAEKDLRDALSEISEMTSDVSDTSLCTTPSIVTQNVSYAD